MLCEFLGRSTGETTRVYGTGCPRERTNGIAVDVYECEKFTRCVAFPRGVRMDDPTIKRCVECKFRPSLAPPHPPH